jgi:uncharacterized protein
MEFEWDSAKDASNLRKHGVPFDFAKSAWDDSGRVERPDTRSDYGEPRCISFARIGVRVYVITHTQREGRTRIISARKANSRETRNYEICQVHS